MSTFRVPQIIEFDNLPPIGESSGDSMTLTDQLKHMLDSYFYTHPHMSLNALALKSGVGATTLRRIKNQDIKGDPAPHTVLSLVSSLTNERRLSVLVEKFDGPLGELLKESFGPYIETQIDHAYRADLNSFLRDSTSYFVYKLCSNRSGATLEQIQKNYGLVGTQKLKGLIENKLIEEKKGTYFSIESNYSLDIEVVLNHLPQLTAHFKTEEVSKGQNLFYTLSESLSEEGIQKVKEAQKEAIKKIIDIMKSPFYEGDIPYFTLAMSDTQAMPEKPEVYQ